MIRKENEGSAAARNDGLVIATGDFIGFIDSDDVIAINFYEKLYKTLQVNNADIAECGFTEFKSESPPVWISPLRSDKNIHYDTEASIRAYLDGHLSVVVWNKLYRKEILKDILFPKGKYIDDIFWTYKVFANSEKIVRIAEVLYFYRQHENSITGRNYSIKRMDALLAWEEMITFMEKKFPTFVPDFRKGFSFLLIDNYIQLKRHKEVDPDKFHRITLLKKIKNYNQWSELRNWNWKEVVWYQLYLCSPAGYEALRKYMDDKSAKLQKIKK